MNLHPASPPTAERSGGSRARWLSSGVGTSSRRWLSVATVLIALIVAACTGDNGSQTDPPSPAATDMTSGAPTTSGSPSTPDAPATSTPDDFSLPASNPAGAEITLDEAAAGTASIGPDGGELEAVGADGRTYRLTIPPGFLASPIEITMTPITEMTTAVLDDFAGGVALQPDGLVFPGVVWLEITGGTQTEGLVGFTYTGSGEEVALGNALVDQDAIRVPVTHFSGAGAGTPSPDAGEWPPSGSYPAMGSAVTAAYIGNEFLCIDSSHPLGGYLPTWYGEMFETLVAPGLEAATSNDLVLSEAIRALLEWKAVPQHHEALVCGDVFEAMEDVQDSSGKRAEDRADELVFDGLVNAIDTAARSCATTHDLGEVKHIADWGGVAAILLGGEDDGLFEIQNLMDERTRGCLTFELDFRSYVELNEGESKFSAEMEATIEPIIPEAQAQVMGWSNAEGDMSAVGPLKYVPKLDLVGYESCPIEITDIQAEPAFAILPGIEIGPPSRQVPINPNQPGGDATGGDTDSDGEKGNDDFLLIFGRLGGSEYFDATCTDLLGGPNPDGAWGPFTFNELHEKEWNSHWEGFSIVLQRGPGKLYGRATYESESGSVAYERTTFDLFHKAPSVP